MIGIFHIARKFVSGRTPSMKSPRTVTLVEQVQAHPPPAGQIDPMISELDQRGINSEPDFALSQSIGYPIQRRSCHQKVLAMDNPKLRGWMNRNA
jgi:hypothetical protein